jgi:hypothetical protein
MSLLGGDRSEVTFIPGWIAGIRKESSRLIFLAPFRRAKGPNTAPAFRQLFCVTADALTIRRDLCQPKRRSDAL